MRRSIKKEEFLKMLDEDGGGVERKDVEVRDEKRKELDRTLDEIDERYAASDSFTLNGEKVEKYKPEVFDGATDDEIEFAAKSKYEPTLREKKGEITEEYEDKREKVLIEAAKDAEKREGEKKSNLAKFDDKIEDVKNAQIKRGMSRSSVLEQLVKGVADAKDDYLADFDKEKAYRTEQKERSLSAIGKKLESELNELDRKTREKIEKVVDEGIRERDKEKEAVEKRNAASEKAYKKKLEELGFADGVFDETLTDEYAARYADKFKALLAYYKSFGNQAAKKLAEDKAYVESRLDEGGYEYLKRFL